MAKILLLLFLFCSSVMPAAAQNLSQSTPTEMSLPQITQQLETINKVLTTSAALSKEQTSDFWQQLTHIQTDLGQTKQEHLTELSSVQKKLKALGDAPENPADEPDDIAKQRKEFIKQSDKFKSQIVQIELTLTKIDELNNLILKQRNQQLLDNILVKQSSIFHPQEFWNSLVSFVTFNYELIKSPLQWYKNVSPDRRTEVNTSLIGVTFGMLAALTCAYFLRRYIRRRWGYDSTVIKPDYSRKVRAGLWMFVARGLIPATILGAFLVWLHNNKQINTDDFGLLLKTAATYLLAYYLCKAVIKVIFTPFNSKWRLIEVPDKKAKAISSALILSAAAICIVSFFQSLAAGMEYDSSIVYALKIFANAVKTFCIILVAYRALYDTPTLSEADIKAETPIAELSTSSKASIFIMAATAAAFSVSLFGYIRLSEYIINKSILSAVTIGIFYITANLIRGLLHRILLMRFWLQTFRLNRRTLAKTEIWFNLIFTPIVFICGFLVLLAVWGVPVDLLLARTGNFLRGFDIGGIHISLTSIFLGLISFFIMLSLFNMLKNSFTSGSLSKIDMDEGIRNSVVSSINFLGLIISGILAIAVMGGSLSSIALIAGALSFGVGLGLQNMVSNLAAGMTILWERPLKIGDLVNINGQEGTVRQINMRSTELEIGDKSVLIIPNSDILSKSFINYTYNGKMGKLVLKINISYESDIDKALQIMLEIAADQRDILSTPTPTAVISNLTDTNLELSLAAYTANVFNRGNILNTLRGRLIERFKKEGISLPAPKPPVLISYHDQDQAQIQ